MLYLQNSVDWFSQQFINIQDCARFYKLIKLGRCLDCQYLKPALWCLYHYSYSSKRIFGIWEAEYIIIIVYESKPMRSTRCHRLKQLEYRFWRGKSSTCKNLCYQWISSSTRYSCYYYFINIEFAYFSYLFTDCEFI